MTARSNIDETTDLTDHHAIRLYGPNINPPEPKPIRKCECIQKKDQDR